MTTRIIFDGREYASPEDMPEDVLRAYRQALAALPDADGDGIPDALGGQAGGTLHWSVTVNGRTYGGSDEVPTSVRRLCEEEADGASAGRRRVLAGLDEAQAVLEGTMRVLLGGLAGAVFAGAILIMADMDASSRSQGGRVYVALAAVVALGAVDSRFAWLARRRWLLADGGAAEYRRYRVRSLLFLGLATVALLGLAVFLP